MLFSGAPEAEIDELLAPWEPGSGLPRLLQVSAALGSGGPAGAGAGGIVALAHAARGGWMRCMRTGTRPCGPSGLPGRCAGTRRRRIRHGAGAVARGAGRGLAGGGASARWRCWPRCPAAARRWRCMPLRMPGMATGRGPRPVSKPCAQEPANRARPAHRLAVARAGAAVLPAVLALAQRTPAHLEQARKLCQAEAGSRNPCRPTGRWGPVCHALAVHRGGRRRLDEAAFERPEVPLLAQFWRVMLRAWLGDVALASGRRQPAAVRQPKPSTACMSVCKPCGLRWFGQQLNAARMLEAGEPVPDAFFPGQRQESWRLALEALQALAGEARARRRQCQPHLVGGQPGRRRRARHHRAAGAAARGPRGWNKPRPLPLARLAEDDRLEPWDARVARAVRRDQSYHRRYARSRRGHARPGRASCRRRRKRPSRRWKWWKGRPRWKSRQAATPVVSLPVREAPALDSFLPAGSRAMPRPCARSSCCAKARSACAIRPIFAQQGAAQLIADGKLAVPAEAHAQLDATPRALSGHFQVHSDHDGSARELETGEPSARRAVAAGRGPGPAPGGDAAWSARATAGAGHGANG
ncbi:hypothetical protein ACU4GD_22155 [Cupriavidus basilensis]